MKRQEGRQRSRRVVRSAILGGVLATGAWGCALIAGVDFDDVRVHALSFEAGFGSGGDAAMPEGGSCPADQKWCSGTCVSKTDPVYGCAGAGCTPCSLALATGSACNPSGACVPKGCAAGFDDCDHDPANGCEADLLRPSSCGSCGNACDGGLLCAPSGCVDTCPPPLVACNGSCVDTRTSVVHCGGCNQACDGGANADPACITGTCAIVCRSGFADCTSSTVKDCAPMPKWYVDDDGDNYGTNAFVTACAQPAGHAPASGDCLDSNPSVHPGAAASDVPFAGPAGPSYDYDCNGTEVEDNAPVHYTGACAAGCTGGGYLPLTPPRAGNGVSDYCGSSGYHVCYTYGSCNSYDLDAGTKIKCN